MRILVIADDFWHPANVPMAGLERLSMMNVAFDWITDAQDWTADLMAQYPLTILTKSNNRSSTDTEKWMTPAIEQAFVDYVSAGHGLIAIHSGTAGYQENMTLRALLGGVFLQHPPQCDVTIEPRGESLLTDGVTPFTVRDEHYHMAVDDPEAIVILTAKSIYGEQPAGWLRHEGQGKVAVLTPGHNLDVWMQPAYQLMITHAIQHCAASAQ